MNHQQIATAWGEQTDSKMLKYENACKCNRMPLSARRANIPFFFFANVSSDRCHFITSLCTFIYISSVYVNYLKSSIQYSSFHHPIYHINQQVSNSVYFQINTMFSMNTLFLHMLNSSHNVLL